MKVTTQNLARSIARELSTASTDLWELQQRIATGKRINKPSDDPVNSVRASQMHSALSEIDRYKKNVTYSKSYVQTTLTSLDQMLEIFSRVQELAVSQSSSSANAQTRSATATEVRNLIEQAVLLANTRLGGKYIFAGHDTKNAPFSSDGTYIGDSGALKINISSGGEMKINLSGNEVFDDSNGGADIFGTLSALKTALQANDTYAISNTIDDISDGFDVVNTRIAEAGAKLNRLDSSERSIDMDSTNMKIILSETEEIDLAKAVIELTSRQNVLEAAMASSGRILRLNLVNYL